MLTPAFVRWSLLILLPSAAIAQTPTVSATREETAAPDPFARVRPGQRVRWSEQGSTGHLNGQYRGRTDTVVTVWTREGMRSIPLRTVDTVWTRGRSAGTGALVGSVVVGCFLGMVARGVDDFYGGNSPALAFASGFAIGAPVGAVLGAGIGALIPRWRRRFP